MAHERKHSAILKLMETTKYQVVKRAGLTPDQQNAEAKDKASQVNKARQGSTGQGRRCLTC